jgi:hypothetical protein
MTTAAKMMLVAEKMVAAQMMLGACRKVAAYKMAAGWALLGDVRTEDTEFVQDGSCT